MINTDWFVGFMEGEGTFIAKRPKYQCEVNIYNTEIDLILACNKFLTSNYILNNVYTSYNRGGKRKPIHRVNLIGLNDCRLLYTLIKEKMDCRINQLESIIGASTTTRETTVNLNWLIGFYEAEACFTISTQYRKCGKICHKPEIVMENTNFMTITKTVKTLFDLGLSWYISDSVPENPNWKPSKTVKIVGCKRVTYFLRATKNLWIGSKTCRKVKLITEFCESRLSKMVNEPYSEREHSIAHEIKQLKT